MLRRRHEPYVLSAALAGLLAAGSMSSIHPTFASGRPGPVVSQDGRVVPAASVLDGVFTAGQATRGRQTFQRACSSCHAVADHTGRRFQGKWADSTLGEMFDFISTTMPDGNPGSLEPDDYASVIAFVLAESGYPKGEQELPSDRDALMKIRIEPLVPR